MTSRALILVEGTRGNGPLFVQAAKRLGLHPITLSADPSRYDYLAMESSEAIRVDTDNVDALHHECCRLRATHEIAGITSATESFYATAGRLCRYFHLPGPNPASIERCCDKFAQRQLLAEAGIPIPAYSLAATAADVECAVANIGLPVILKPTVGIGSSGVRLCRNDDELAEHTTYLLDGKHVWRSSPRILVEEFVQGPQYVIHLMGTKVIGVAAAEFWPLPHFVYRGTTFPALLSDEEHERVVEVSLRCLRALDLGWGPTCIELRWTERGPVVIEVNPRLAGDAQLVQLGYGIDLITEHIKLVTGDECNLRRKHSHSAAARYLIADRDGTLDWIDGQSRAADLSGVAEVKFFVKPKTPIIRRGDSRDCIGYVYATSPDLAQAQAILQRAVDLVGWSITPFSPRGEQEQSAPAEPTPSVK